VKHDCDRCQELEAALAHWRRAGYDGIDAIADKLGRVEAERDAATLTTDERDVIHEFRNGSPSMREQAAFWAVIDRLLGVSR
jgi:hypothetical protein